MKKQDRQTIMFCQDGVFSTLVQQRPYSLIFKTTNWCWNNCAHCCESSGPNNPKTFIPETVIKQYIDQAVQDPTFSKNLVFTGGEIMAAYKFVDEKYVPNILNYALDNKINTDIKTNAGWTGTPIAQKIFKDLETVVRKHAKNKDQNNLVPLQVSLSLDRFHNDAIDRNFRFIEHFANSDPKNASFNVHIASFSQDRQMFYQLMQKISYANIDIDNIFIMDTTTGQTEESKMFYLNDRFVVEYSCAATLFAGGRARNLANSFQTPVPQFTFLSPNHFELLMAFDSCGNVTLGENSGDKISVPWRNPDGTTRNLSDIRQEIVAATKAAETEYRKKHRLLDIGILAMRKIPFIQSITK